VKEFLIEGYVGRDDVQAAASAAARARAEEARLGHRGMRVRLLRWIFVPQDECCFFLVEAGSLEAVHDLVRLAGLPCDHVGEAVGAAGAAAAPAGPDVSDGGRGRSGG
jgi:hypothetical protein